MRCEKCGNAIKELFFKTGDGYVCRRCLVYKDSDIEKAYKRGSGEYLLDYDLTVFQKEASDFVLKCIRSNKDCILNAVTGAGKTEIIYPLIKYCVDNNYKLAIAIPRKDVVIELFLRIKKDFKNASVIALYGGNNQKLYADIIVLTTHQLYRYKEYFDIVVIDEVDAFPFYNNDMLNNFLKRSVKGNIVYMSATVPRKLINSKIPIYYLNKRYHNQNLDVPKIKYLWSKKSVLKMIQKYNKNILIVYFPTIKEQVRFSKILKIEHYVINSKTSNRKEVLERLHTSDQALILSTLVLERGITFKNCNVIVVNADHPLFSYQNLVQMAGRVGRHYLFSHGDIIFLVNSKNKQVKKAIQFIKKCNE